MNIIKVIEIELLKEHLNFKYSIDFIKVKYTIFRKDYTSTSTYGFSIQTLNSKNIHNFEEIGDFTDDLKYAEDIFKILVNENVLPNTLGSVLDDINSAVL